MGDRPSPLFYKHGANDSQSESESEVSVTSTQPEEWQDEYTVERILSEQQQDDGSMKYLGTFSIQCRL